MIVRLAFIIFLCTTLFSISNAQEEILPRPSPLAIASARYKDTYLKITYSQPQKHGRDIFGSLVPYGEVWRTGANESTEITITRDVMISGNALKQGTYSIFTIPGKDQWTIIFNSDVGQWGAYTYSTKLDVFRITVPVQQIAGSVYEPFTIFINQKNDKADIDFYWDKTKVSLPVLFTEPKNP